MSRLYKKYNLDLRHQPEIRQATPTVQAPSLVSPYLNFDPAYITSDTGSEFIFPEGASRQRGRFELAFSQIGGCVFAGAAFGGVNGLYSGFLETKELTGAAKRTQLLNFITKKGAVSAQSLGVIALMYSAFGVILSLSRGTEDELNTMTAGTCTGLLYKSSAGWKKCVRGGLVGFSLAAVYCIYTSQDRLKAILSKD
ncbi:hypothetical protein CHS0354_039150 [Potamilus streckersoni]|uniref:Mitochondrial import inner membrane translocase subunit Tim23 n=1 Tax=Potamilus streckersoni TaxID=2493646 RepID=A0AAE0VRQ2_9BIVA|nr:hypothetical protein CHS0354_039150 [Potamilus streckersoni]